VCIVSVYVGVCIVSAYVGVCRCVYVCIVSVYVCIVSVYVCLVSVCVGVGVGVYVNMLK